MDFVEGSIESLNVRVCLGKVLLDLCRQVFCCTLVEDEWASEGSHWEKEV